MGTCGVVDGDSLTASVIVRTKAVSHEDERIRRHDVTLMSRPPFLRYRWAKRLGTTGSPLFVSSSFACFQSAYMHAAYEQ